MLRQVELSVGRPQDLTWKRPPGRPRTKWTDQLPRDNNTTMFPLRLCGGKLLVAVTRERRYGPSRLRVDDDDDDVPNSANQHATPVVLGSLGAKCGRMPQLLLLTPPTRQSKRPTSDADSVLANPIRGATTVYSVLYRRLHCQDTEEITGITQMSMAQRSPFARLHSASQLATSS